MFVQGPLFDNTVPDSYIGIMENNMETVIMGYICNPLFSVQIYAFRQFVLVVKVWFPCDAFSGQYPGIRVYGLELRF